MLKVLRSVMRGPDRKTALALRITCLLTITALSRVPFAPWQSSELEAALAEPPPCPLGVAPPGRRVPALRPHDLLGRPLQQLPRRAQAQPPVRNQGRHRPVHLAPRQLPVFPPRIPAPSAAGTGH